MQVTILISWITLRTAGFESTESIFGVNNLLSVIKSSVRNSRIMCFHSRAFPRVLLRMTHRQSCLLLSNNDELYPSFGLDRHSLTFLLFLPVSDGQRLSGLDPRLHCLRHPSDCDVGCSTLGTIFWQEEDSNKSRLCFCNRRCFRVFNDVIDCSGDAWRTFVFRWESNIEFTWAWN